jgi:outer membrane lipoprotein-sorting protein
MTQRHLPNACILLLSILSFSAAACAEDSLIPSAKEIILKVAERYRAPQRYYMSGMVTGKLRISPSGIEPTPVIIAAEFPDKFRMEGDLSSLGLKGLTLILLDGKTGWAYDKVSNKFYKILRSSKPGTAGQKPGYGQVDFSKPEEVVPYFDHYLFVRYRGNYKAITATAVLRVESLQAKDKKLECYVVQIDYGDFNSQTPGSGRNTWWVDKNSFLIWKETNETWTSSPAFLESQNQTYDTLLMDEPLPKKIFDFKPPKGSSELQMPKP